MQMHHLESTCGPVRQEKRFIALPYSADMAGVVAQSKGKISRVKNDKPCWACPSLKHMLCL